MRIKDKARFVIGVLNVLSGITCFIACIYLNRGIRMALPVEWLTDYKELKNSIGAIKLSNITEALELIREYKAENIAQKKLIAEYKRLLKLAVEDISTMHCNNDTHRPESCYICVKHGNCSYSDSFKWCKADEALKLIGEANEP